MRHLLIFLAAFATVHAVRAQNDSKGNKGKVQLNCAPVPFIPSDSDQNLHLECGGFIPEGRAGLANFNWQNAVNDAATIRRTTLLVSAFEGTIGGEGEERISLHTTLLRDDLPVPTCQSKSRITLGFNRTVSVNIEPKVGVRDDSDDDKHPKMRHVPKWDDHGPRPEYDPEFEERHYGYSDSGYGFDEDKDYGYDADVSVQSVDAKYEEWDGTEDEHDDDAELSSWSDHSKSCPHKVPKQTKRSPDHSSSHDHEQAHDHYDVDEEAKHYSNEDSQVATSALPSQEATPGRRAQGHRKKQTPGGLRVVVKCKSADLQGPNPNRNSQCSVLLRLQVRFNPGFVATRGINQQDRAVASLDTNTCRTVTFLDLLNVLDTTQLNGGAGPTVDTQVCSPPNPFPGAARRLTQAQPTQAEPAQTGSPTIAAGAVWDADALARAVRVARYASAIHGCIPGVRTPSGAIRTWADTASWGGPAGAPTNIECRSCFKDGIVYGPGLGGGPVGWETPDFSANALRSFRDAAIVLTDTAITPGAPSIVVQFRATVNNIPSVGANQWISNIGICGIEATDRQAVAASNPRAGTVCAGWREPITSLNRGNNGVTTGITPGTQNGPTIGLMDEVKRRIQALRPDPTSDDTPTRIFVTGWSRGGALAAVFAAELLVEQEAGRLGTYVGPVGPRAQVSLYTMGAPAAGDTDFSQYLETRMYERFRLINRYDPVPYAPFQVQGYNQNRPSVWFRDSSGFLLPSPSLYCVLTPETQLSAGRRQCFISCNSALVCAYNVAVPAADAAAGTLVPASTACEDVSIGLVAAANLVGRGLDHGTYMGIDLGNSAPGGNDCRFDLSVYAAGCIQCRTDGRVAAGAGVCP